MWKWKLEEFGVFSVKSAYEALSVLIGPVERWGVEEKRVFNKL